MSAFSQPACADELPPQVQLDRTIASIKRIFEREPALLKALDVAQSKWADDVRATCNDMEWTHYYPGSMRLTEPSRCVARMTAEREALLRDMFKKSLIEHPKGDSYQRQ